MRLRAIVSPMKLQNVLAYIATGTVFLALLTPFVFYTPLFFPFITAKAYYFRVLVALGFFAWAGLAVLNPVYRPKRSWVVVVLSVFMLVLLAANLQGINPVYSFWSNFERMEGYITFLHLVAFFFVATSMLRTQKIWDRFLNVAVVVGFLQVVWAGLQVAGVLAVGLSQDRIDGTLGNATYLAIYMVFTFFIALFLLLKKHYEDADIAPKTISYWYGFVMIATTVATFWTATRGSLFALIGGVFVTAIIMAIVYPRRKSLRYAAYAISGLIIAFLLLVTVFKDSPLVQNVNALRRIASISMTETTTIARFYNWNTAWQGIQQRPILGYGLGNYGPVFDTYYTPKMWNQEQWFDRVHNVIFDWLIAAGFTGLLAYLALFGVILYYVWKKDSVFSKTEKAVLTGLLLAYIVHNMFVFDNLVSYMYFFIVLVYVHVRVVGFDKKEVEQDSQHSLLQSIGVLALIVVVFPVTVWAVNASSFNQGTQLIKAFQVLRNPDSVKIADVLARFKEALSVDTFGTTETRQQLLSVASRIVQASNVPLEDKQAFATFTAEQITKEIAKNPNDPKFMIIAGQFLAQTGNFDQAKTLFQRAIAISPKKQFLYQPLIEILFKENKNTEALAMAKEVYMIEPANDGMWRQYVRSALRAGDRDLYTSLLDEAFATQRADRVIALVQQNIDADPNSVQPYASLAVTYYKAGMKEDAIKTLEFIGQKFGAEIPAAKVQADGLIQKIKAGEPIQ